MQIIVYPPDAGRYSSPTTPRILECGFRFLKDFDGNQEPTLIPSTFAWISGRNRVTKSTDTVEVELISTTNQTSEAQALVGKRWVIGKNAVQVGGKPLFRCGKHSKANLCLPMVLAGIGSSNSHQQNQTIPNLLLSLPDIDSISFEAGVDDRERMIATVTGTHTFKWNGVTQSRTIKEAEVVYEGHGIYDWGLWHGLVPEADLLIVDIGGQTCNLLVVDANGEVIPGLHQSFEVGGTLNLANRIANDADFKTKCGSGAKLEEIMDTIATASILSATEGSEINPYYGAGVNAVSFKAEFERHSNAWIDQLLGELDTRMKDHWHQLGKSLIGGGSATLLTNRLQGQDFFEVVPEPQVAHIKGLMLRHEPNLAACWIKGMSNGF
ncbi:MAG TPA: hypothetical protein V6C90_15390 [Coleofasciculaceae cyanobacterium]|jgi:hypothetical protein